MRALKLTFTALAIAGAFGALGGCAVMHPALATRSRPAASPVDVGVDWSWSVAGDQAVRPLQVFAVHGKTYLQMRPGQIMPAILVDGVPVAFSISSPYIVIHGEPARIDIVADGYRAVAMRQSAGVGPAHVMPAVQPSRVHRVSLAGKEAEFGQSNRVVAITLPVPQPAAHVVALAPVPEPAPVPVATQMPRAQARAVVASAPELSGPTLWRVNAAQGRLSRVVRAWGARSGVSVRWDAPVDVPVRASGEIKASDFYGALAKALRAASSGGWTFAMEFAPKGLVVIRAYRVGSA